MLTGNRETSETTVQCMLQNSCSKHFGKVSGKISSGLDFNTDVFLNRLYASSYWSLSYVVPILPSFFIQFFFPLVYSSLNKHLHFSGYQRNSNFWQLPKTVFISRKSKTKLE